VTQASKGATLDDVGDLGRVLLLEEHLVHLAAGGLLGDQQCVPRRPADAVEAVPVEAPVAVLSQDLGLARLEVRDRYRAAGVHLVRVVHVAAGLVAALVLRVHVVQVVDAWIDVQNGLVLHHPLVVALGDDVGDCPVGRGMAVRGTFDGNVLPGTVEGVAEREAAKGDHSDAECGE